MLGHVWARLSPAACVPTHHRRGCVTAQRCGPFTSTLALEVFEIASRQIDRLPARFAMGLGLALGVAATLSLSLGGWKEGWNVGALVLAVGLIVPWALSGRPILRAPRRALQRAESHPPSAPRRRVLRFQIDGEAVHVPLVDLPGGTFWMGAKRFDDERPIHPVCLPPLSIMDVPVTQELFGSVMGVSWNEAASGPDVPVTEVSWLSAINFCNRASEGAGLAPAYAVRGDQVTWDPTAPGFRLPLEAEWEYAARAGTITEYFFGAEHRARDYAWFGDASLGPQPVRGKKPNDWGLYDMAGNVWEWCWDAYDRYEDHVGKMADEAFLSAGPGADRVLRGGSFEFRVVWLRSAFRLRLRPLDKSGDFGFRCVLGARPAGWPF